MTIVDPLYNPADGVYVCVVPVLPLPVLAPGVGDGFEVSLDHHITVVHDETANIDAALLEAFFIRNNITSDTIFDAYSLTRPSVWVNKGKAYIGIEFFSVDLFALHEKMKSELGVVSTFQDYKCHLTLGRYVSLPGAILADPAALRAMIPEDYKIPAKLELTGIKLAGVRA